MTLTESDEGEKSLAGSLMITTPIERRDGLTFLKADIQYRGLPDPLEHALAETVRLREAIIAAFRDSHVRVFGVYFNANIHA